MSLDGITVLHTFYSNAKRTDYVLGKDKYGSLKLYKGHIYEPLHLVEQKNVYVAGPTKWIHRKHFDKQGKEIGYSFVSKFTNSNGKNIHEISVHDASMNMEKGYLKLANSLDGKLSSAFKKYKYTDGRHALLKVLDKDNLTPLAKRVLSLLKK